MLHQCYTNVTFRFAHPFHPHHAQLSASQRFTAFLPFFIFIHFVLPPLNVCRVCEDMIDGQNASANIDIKKRNNTMSLRFHYHFVLCLTDMSAPVVIQGRVRDSS